MASIQRSSDNSSLADVVERILDKGIVVDAWVSVSLVGIELLTIRARVVVASVDTYLRYADALGLTQQSLSMKGPIPYDSLSAIAPEMLPSKEPITNPESVDSLMGADLALDAGL